MPLHDRADFHYEKWIRSVAFTVRLYGDMVLMSMEAYEEACLKLKLYQELEISEQQIQEGKVMDAKDSLARLKAKYEL